MSTDRHVYAPQPEQAPDDSPDGRLLRQALDLARLVFVDAPRQGVDLFLSAVRFRSALPPAEHAEARRDLDRCYQAAADHLRPFPVISREKLERLIAKGRRDAAELDASIRSSFTMTPEDYAFRLGGAATRSNPRPATGTPGSTGPVDRSTASGGTWDAVATAAAALLRSRGIDSFKVEEPAFFEHPPLKFWKPRKRDKRRINRKRKNRKDRP